MTGLASNSSPASGLLDRNRPDRQPHDMTTTAMPAADSLPTRLAVQFADGEPRAFELLVATHYQTIHRTVQRLVGWSQAADGYDADDITQEVFARAIEKHRQFRADAQLPTWLTQIAINVCRSRARRRRLRQLFWAHQASEPAKRSTSTSPESHLETSESIQRAVARLATKHREAIVLHYLEERSVDEVATLLRTTPAAIRKRLARAREQLKPWVSEL